MRCPSSSAPPRSLLVALVSALIASGAPAAAAALPIAATPSKMPANGANVKPASGSVCLAARPEALAAFASPDMAVRRLLAAARGGGCAVRVACGPAGRPPVELFLGGCPGGAGPVRLRRATGGGVEYEAIAVEPGRWQRPAYAFPPGAPAPDVSDRLPENAIPRFAALWRALDKAHPKRGAGATLELVLSADAADPPWRGVRLVDGDRLLGAALFASREHQPSAFFGLDGKAVGGAFLASPLDQFEVSRGVKMVRLSVREFVPATKKAKAHLRLRTRRILHKGIDFAAATGTPIRATADGVVEFAGKMGGFGNFVVLRHAGGYATRYGHMLAFADGLAPGRAVALGDVIGFVGSTGLSTGPHVHYELKLADRMLDPARWAPPSLASLTPAEFGAWLAANGALFGGAEVRTAAATLDGPPAMVLH